MTEKVIYPDIITYSSIIQVLADGKKEVKKAIESDDPSGCVSKCLMCFAKKVGRKTPKLSWNGFDPNVVAYNTLIDGYCLQGWLHEAKQVFIRWFRAVFNLTLINGYCKRMENRQRHRSCERNVSKTIKTWNCNIHQYCIAGIISSREILPCTKISSGVSSRTGKEECWPQLFMYDVVIAGLCKKGKLDIPQDIFNNCVLMVYMST
uniref:Pentatricopeptide repeat-containing protein n=1 Tax=Solanum lycopersicum TaxID=4081 RepID=A0A3Q7EIE9_SOLLC